ncbi:MAG: hypothetical protein D6738_12495 [Acidobacteria bacterium]|nr:MAG: hypothetical protein D6738_12495 [Acidobacteriota bacterium]
MRLARVRIARMPGIDEPFELAQLDTPHVVIAGPNEAGKTTVRRAVAAVLWPELVDAAAVDIEIEFRASGRRLVARRSGREVAWFRDGTPSSPPAVPPPRFAPCFQIGVEDLIAAEGDDARFAAELRRQMAGGLDLDAAIAARRERARRRVTRLREAQRLAEAEREVRRIQAAQRDLARRAGRIADLERQLDRARRIERERERVALAVRLAQARRRHARAGEELASFPSGLDLLSGREPEQLRRLDARRDEARRERDEAERRVADARERFAREGLSREDLARIDDDLLSGRGVAVAAAPAWPLPVMLAGAGLGLALLMLAVVEPWAGWRGALLAGTAASLGAAAGAWLAWRRAARHAAQSAREHAERGRDLAARVVRARDALAAIDRAERELAVASRRLGEIERERREFLDALGLDDAGTRTLAERVARLDAYRGLREEMRLAEREIADLEPRVDPALAQAPADDLARRLAETEEQRERIERLVGEIERLRAEVDGARRSDALARALAARDRARRELEARAADIARARIEIAILEHLRERHARDALPPALEQARRMFARITDHRWRLDLVRDDGGPGFVAVDVARGVPCPLDRLSTGTRMQLLLAVRLGFVATLAGGERPPIFFDEALAHADPRRVGAILEGLARVVADDWQAVHLTCHAIDPGRWAEASGGSERVRFVDLAAQRRLARHADNEPIGLGPAAPAEPFDPADPEAMFRRAGVPPLDPDQPPRRWHVWYLLEDDLPLLAQVLGAGIETVGQLEALIDAGGAEALAGPGRVADLRSRCAVAGKVAAAWRIGRPAPLSPGDLEAACDEAGVAGRWREPLEEIRSEVDGDAAALCARLERGGRDPRLRRFRAETAERLAEVLEARGHLDDREPLAGDEIVAAAIAAAGHRAPGAAGTIAPLVRLARALVERLERAVAVTDR